MRNELSAALLALAAMLPVAEAGATAAAPTPAFEAELLTLQHDWAEANYTIADAARKEVAFEALAQRAESFAKANPARAEPLIWQGIVLSTYAGVKGGLGALGLCRQARGRLEAARKLDPAALDGSAYTSLGALYYKVPGFPLGFGDHKKAAQLLESALRLNPEGIDANYFYGDYLVGEGRYAEALRFLEVAQRAPARANRQVADQGRHAEITALIGKARQKMS
jgi:tetratricopeptide (TPR) repeat protein